MSYSFLNNMTDYPEGLGNFEQKTACNFDVFYKTVRFSLVNLYLDRLFIFE